MDLDWDADLSVSGTFGGKLEVSFDVRMKVVSEVEVDFEAGIKADCYFKITADVNAQLRNAVDLKTDFSGLIVTGYYKFSVRRKGSDNAPKEFDPVKLIPSVEDNVVRMQFGNT